MYGWRGRIGLLIPSRNLVVETDFHVLKPEGISIHSARIWRETSEVTVDSQYELANNALMAARTFNDSSMDLIVFACTSGSFLGGHEFEKQLVQNLSEAAGAPCITTSRAVLESLEYLNVQRILLITPYIEEINEREIAFLTNYGFQVVGCHTFNLKKAGIYYARIPPADIYSFAKKSVLASDKCDAVFISCTNLAALSTVGILEQDLGIPVISSNQATFWLAMRKLGVSASISGYGRLLSEPHHN